MDTNQNLKRLLTALTLLGAAALAGCGGGAKTEENPNTTPPSQPQYAGPAPATDDVQAFRINLWDNINASNRCGGCHNAGGQAPTFARVDDINLAYQAANTAVTLGDPASSRMVTKVAGGHNCWLSSNAACADLLTTWIRNWSGSTGGTGTQIQLLPPVLRDVGNSRSFPDTPPAGFAGVHALLTANCSRCHTTGSSTPQSPFFAAPNAVEAYAAARTKIDLDNVALSRLVVRLRNEFHNCWTASCANDADLMQARIQAMVDQIPPNEVDPSLSLSKALSLYDGTVAAGGSRHDANAIAKWEFKTGTGSTAFDTSGVEPALNLTLTGDVSWVGGWGIHVRPGGKAQGSTAASRKLHSLITGTGEYSVELWVAAANVMQEDAYMISYSGGATARNFTVAQQQYQIEAYNRSSAGNANGQPVLITAAADEDLQATLQHIVVTFSPVNGRRIYVNGEFTGDVDGQTQAAISDWDDTFALVLGNEVSGNRPFEGVFRMAAVHNRALTAEQIRENFEAGVGERYYLLFSISHLVDVPQAYILFEVSQYDSYSYLFTRPTFISLDEDARPGSIPIQGMRIGLNGAELPVGQAYRMLDTTISDSNYAPGLGQPLSTIGTVVGLQKGPASDLFFLCFDRLGSRNQVCSRDANPVAPVPVNGEPQPDIGIKTFDEINASMAVVTGISPSTTSVRDTFDTVKQAMPSNEAIEGFSASQQSAVTQLAVAYCNALANDGTRRASFFPGFNFAAHASTAFDNQTKRDQIIVPLYNRMVGTNLLTQPSLASLTTELNTLIGRLTACGAGCGPNHTVTVVTAVCAATLGSAITTVQ